MNIKKCAFIRTNKLWNMPKQCSDRTGRWPGFCMILEFGVLRVWGEMRRGARPPRLLSGLLSGDKANWLGDVQATAVGSSGWRGWSDTGRRPQSLCCIRWTLLPAKYRRAAALTLTQTDIHTLTGIISRRRLHHHTPSPSKLSRLSFFFIFTCMSTRYLQSWISILSYQRLNFKLLIYKCTYVTSSAYSDIATCL